MYGDVVLGTRSNLEHRRTVREDIAIRREELGRKFAFATRRFGKREMQIANLAGFQVPFCFAMGAPSGQRAASWEPAYGDEATGGHPISTVNCNSKGYMLTGGRLERSRRRDDWR
jgi:hypothetical protein